MPANIEPATFFYFMKDEFLISDILSNEAFWIVNKKIASHFKDNDTAILLADLISKQKYFENKGQLNEGFFFNTSENIERDCNISYHKQKKCIENLKKIGFVETWRTGTPAKLHFKIIENQIWNFLNSSFRKIQNLDLEKFELNNNKYNNNKFNKDSEKDENKFSLSFSPEFEKYLIELENYPLCKKIEVQITDKNLNTLLKEFEFEQIIEGLEIIENSRTVKSRKNLYLTLKKILKNNFGGGKEFQRDLKAFKQVYIDFMVKRNKVEPKLSKTSNSVFIELFEYFKKISNTKDTEGAIKSFKFIFENWNKLDSFLSQKVEIENINRNINEITTKIKNEYGSKTATNNGDYNRLSIQEIARIASQRKDHINPF